MLHFKRQLGVLTDEEQVLLEREALPDSGIAVATIQARSAVPNGDQVGLRVALGGDGYVPGQCEETTDEPAFWCPPGTNWDSYTMEVVDRVGNDSFTPGHGVLLAQAQPSGTPRVWLIDSNPQDIGMIDFYRPDGTPVAVVRGDPRQLNDATWHAGTNSGSEFEYVESFNRLHFYILDTHRDEDGVLTYDVAVRHLDGAGDFQRGVALDEGVATTHEAGLASCTVPLTNTGEAGEGVFDSDVYRVSATSSSDDWEITLPNALAAAAAGETVDTVAHVRRTQDDGDDSTTVTLSATSESDPEQTATSTCAVDAGDPGEVAVVVRHEGEGRVETAVAISQASFPTADTAVIARSDKYPDALAGAPLALDRDAPLLLTGSDSLPEATRAELARLGVTNVVLLGGEAAISQDVEDDLTQSYAVERIDGVDRFDTAALIAAELPAATLAFLAEGVSDDPARGFPDPLSAAPYAAFVGAPILLTVNDQLPERTAQALAERGVTETVVVGGEAAVSASVFGQLEADGRGPRRLAGETRYETSVAVYEEATAAGMSPGHLYLATGTDFPDALTAAPAVASGGDTFLLIDGNDLANSPATREALEAQSDLIDMVSLVGGRFAISESVEQQIRDILEAG